MPLKIIILISFEKVLMGFINILHDQKKIQLPSQPTLEKCMIMLKGIFTVSKKFHLRYLDSSDNFIRVTNDSEYNHMLKIVNTKPDFQVFISEVENDDENESIGANSSLNESSCPKLNPFPEVNVEKNLPDKENNDHSIWNTTNVNACSEIFVLQKGKNSFLQPQESPGRKYSLFGREIESNSQKSKTSEKSSDLIHQNINSNHETEKMKHVMEGIMGDFIQNKIPEVVEKIFPAVSKQPNVDKEVMEILKELLTSYNKLDKSDKLIVFDKLGGSIEQLMFCLRHNKEIFPESSDNHNQVPNNIEVKFDYKHLPEAPKYIKILPDNFEELKFDPKEFTKEKPDVVDRESFDLSNVDAISSTYVPETSENRVSCLFKDVHLFSSTFTTASNFIVFSLKVKNDGDCPWPKGACIFGKNGLSFKPIPLGELPPGKEIDVSGNFNTPKKSGDYTTSMIFGYPKDKEMVFPNKEFEFIVKIEGEEKSRTKIKV